MNNTWRIRNLALFAIAAAAPISWALDGLVNIHDPSTVIQCDGKYYVYGTGGTALVSDDGWTWRAGTRPPRTGLAPDVIHIGDRYFMYVATGSGVTKAEVNVLSSKSLDPSSPDYKWEEGGVVASSDGIEDSNAIDPGAFLDPATGRLWLVYGSYFGYIRQVELDPKTGKRLHPGDKPRDLAVNCEASDMIFHDGWYYLLATHGSCCRGRLRLQHPCGPLPQGNRPVYRQHGHRHDRRRRQAARRLLVTLYRPRPLRSDRSWGRVSRSSQCTTKPTWIAVEPAFWISARCFGRMAGPSPAKT